VFLPVLVTAPPHTRLRAPTPQLGGPIPTRQVWQVIPPRGKIPRLHIASARPGPRARGPMCALPTPAESPRMRPRGGLGVPVPHFLTGRKTPNADHPHRGHNPAGLRVPERNRDRPRLSRSLGRRPPPSFPRLCGWPRPGIGIAAVPAGPDRGPRVTCAPPTEPSPLPPWVPAAPRNPPVSRKG